MTIQPHELADMHLEGQAETMPDQYVSGVIARLRANAEFVEIADPRYHDMRYPASAMRDGVAAIEQLRTDLEEERAIVNRIWDMFGRPSYESLKGRSIYDLIAEAIEQQSRAASAADLLEALELLIPAVTKTELFAAELEQARAALLKAKGA